MDQPRPPPRSAPARDWIGRGAAWSPSAGSASTAWCRTMLRYMTRSFGLVGDGLFARARGNPLLSPARWPYRINAVMNAAATMVGDETVLLCGVEDRRGLSHLTVARSRDGVSNWLVDEDPLIAPTPAHPEEIWGVEDPRVTRVDELDAWVIVYTAFGMEGPAVALALTRDFRSIERFDEWVLGPSEPYELVGDVPGVLFPCGLIHDAATGQLRLYYGAADTCLGMASGRLDRVLAYVIEHG